MDGLQVGNLKPIFSFLNLDNCPLTKYSTMTLYNNRYKIFLHGLLYRDVDNFLIPGGLAVV